MFNSKWRTDGGGLGDDHVTTSHCLENSDLFYLYTIFSIRTVSGGTKRHVQVFNTVKPLEEVKKL